jgi:hypothetical protein
MKSKQDGLLSQPSAAKATKRRREGLTSEERQRMISEAAYQRAERRGFEGGDPVIDWLEAEQEIEERQQQAR